MDNNKEVTINKYNLRPGTRYTFYLNSHEPDGTFIKRIRGTFNKYSTPIGVPLSLRISNATISLGENYPFIPDAIFHNVDLNIIDRVTTYQIGTTTGNDYVDYKINKYYGGRKYRKSSKSSKSRKSRKSCKSRKTRKTKTVKNRHFKCKNA